VSSARREWSPILAEAAGIVRGYDTGVTLRQLFYRLVAAGLIPNTLNAYNRLSRLTAEARRDGWCPPLVDLGRQIDRPLSFPGSDKALEWLRERYRLDRTTGQPWAIYLGVEKATLLALLASWFGDLGIPRVALRGYSSQTLVDDVAEDVAREQDRPAVLIYCGDHDPSGVHIPEDFVRRTGGFALVRRVAVNPDQIARYGLASVPAKLGDSRVRRTGVTVQVEVEALPPETLRDLLSGAVADYWDEEAYQAVLAREEEDRRGL